MTQLVTGLVLFFAVHSVSIVSERWRNRMALRLGELPWMGLYSLLALIGTVLIVRGYGSARLDPVVLYVPPHWLHWLTLVLMLPVFPLLLAAYLPGRIRTATRHPMLAATKLWATAHLLANGTLADLLLFGGFLAWAIADRISLKYRTPRPVPVAATTGYNDLIAVVLGLVFYLAFAFRLHAWLIGVPLFGS